MKAEEFGDALRVIREAGKSKGPVAIPELFTCACGKDKKLEAMPVIKSTGVVERVVDKVCPECRKDYAKMGRIVCCGCREVVALVEPHKEKTGFVFRPGGFYHVLNCPKCVGRMFEKSDIVEKILFYKDRGIPYE